MENPKAPSWFRKELKGFDPRLVVMFNNGAGTWDIAEKVRYRRNYGLWNGIFLVGLEDRLERITTFPAIGSKIFETLKELKWARFKNYYEMMNKLKMQGHQELYNKISVP